MRCIECEEIELARVRDERPGEALPIPYAALDGFPAGRSAADLTRRRLLQWGVAGFASIYGAQALGFEQVWESVAHAQTAPEQKTLVVLYLAGGNDGLNVARARRQAADYSAYTAARPVDPSRAGRLDRGPRRLAALPGAGGGALAFANVVVSKNGGGDNSATRFGFTGTGGDGFGFDSLDGDGSGGAGSDLAVMPAVDAKQYNLSHFDNSDIWFRASNDVNIKTGWLGRWIERTARTPTRCRRSRSTRRCRRRSARRRTRCARSRRCRWAGFTMNSSNYGGSNNSQREPEDARPRARCGRSRQRGPAGGRARRTASPSRPTSASSSAGAVAANAIYLNNSDAVDAAADGRASAGGEPRHADHHDPLGLRSTPTPASSPVRIASSRSSRARWRAFKADLTARGIEQNVSRHSCSPSSAAACARTARATRREPTTARAA